MKTKLEDDETFTNGGVFADVHPCERSEVEHIVTGRVTDADTGQGLPGATVVAKGTSVGTIANIDGQYKLEGAHGLGEHYRVHLWVLYLRRYLY